jgi:hypothetical protein
MGGVNGKSPTEDNQSNDVVMVIKKKKKNFLGKGTHDYESLGSPFHFPSKLISYKRMKHDSLRFKINEAIFII